MVEGVEVAEGDSEEELKEYLLRNPGLSRVAVNDGTIVAAVLCGHDGRRGLIYHLAVDPAYQGREIGQRLLQECVGGCAALASRGPSFWFRERMQKVDHSGCGMVGKISREQSRWAWIFEDRQCKQKSPCELINNCGF